MAITIYLNFRNIISLLVVFASVVGGLGSAEYYELDKTTSWENAVNVCEVATPEIGEQVSKNGFVVNVNHELHFNTVWVGYYMMNTVFDYIGCKKINTPNENIVFTLMIMNNPGLCYSKCKTSGFETVGLSNRKCFCLDSVGLERLHEKSCKKLCLWSGFTCGSDGYMSVYRVNKKGTCSFMEGDNENATCVNGDVHSGQCLLFERHGTVNKRTWRPCTCDHQTACLKTDNTTYIKKGLNWTQSVTHSLENCRSPLLLKDITFVKIKVDTAPTWTGVVRSYSLYTYKELEQCHRILRHGYLKKEGSRVILEFGDTPSVEAVLCKSPTVLPTDANNGLGDTINPTDKQQNDVKDGDVTVPVITAVVAVSCFVVVVVIVIIVLRRRGKLTSLTSCFCLRRSPENRGGHSEINHVNDNNCYASQPNTKLENGLNANDTVDAHNCIALEPKNNEYNAGIVVDVTRSGKEVDSDNIYNTLNESDNATYDHAYNRTQIKYPPDETYDTSEKAVLKLKTNATSEESDTDTYNHINDTNNKYKTDNVYGIPIENSDVYGETRTNYPDNTDQTYSHVGRN